MLRTNKTPVSHAAATAIVVLSSISLLVGQTKIVAPDNKYSISEDVTAGREAAKQVEEQLPLMNDSQVQSFVSHIGERLAESIPREFQHSEFRYTFKVVNVSDINAFALPGGPVFITEALYRMLGSPDEIAAVLGHEIGHVVDAIPRNRS